MHNLAWVEDRAARSVQELQQEAADRGLPTHGNRNQLRARIKAHIGTPPAQQFSTNYFNDDVAEVVDELSAGTDLTSLQEIANAYDISTAGKNFFQLSDDLQPKLSANPTAPAPAAVDDTMRRIAAERILRRQADNHPPENQRRLDNNMKTILGLAAVIAAGFIYFVLIAPNQGWWPSNDNGTTVPTKIDAPPTPDGADDDDAELDELRGELEALEIRIENARDRADREFRKDFNDLLDRVDAVETLRQLSRLESDFEDLRALVMRSNEEPQSTDSGTTNTVSQTGSTNTDWTPSAPSKDLDSMPKGIIESAGEGVWFHRVFNERLFRAPNWDGADSWFVTLALGPNSGGFWTDHGNPGQIVYRGENTNLNWCVAFLTTSQYKSEFLAGLNDIPVAVNVRIAPNSNVTATGPGGSTTQATSDAGDITIILPDDGVVTVCTAYRTAAPTHESLVWWGPYDRSESINTIDAR